MADELPEPKSRKESYLAKAAGMDVTIPEKPESREEQYLNAIAEGGGGGGGGTYTAGDGIDITNDTISVDTDTIQEKLTAGTGINITDNTISATGGGGPTVVQTTGTSTTDVMSQNAVTSMVYADPATKRKIQIGDSASLGAGFPVAIGSGTYTLGDNQVAIGRDAKAGGNANFSNNVAVGYSASANGGSYRVAIGGNTVANNNYSVALGYNAITSRVGEVNIGTGSTTRGYNSTKYRVLGGVHDPVDAHDAATKGYVDTLVGNIESALHAINNGGNA